MADLVTDHSDPRLTRGVDTKPTPQAAAYLVLSDEERAKGFVRPVRRSYIHEGNGGPKHPTRELTADENERYASRYVLYEAYPEGHDILGTFWTQERLDAAIGCGQVTTMGDALAETWARDPLFYGATYCATCRKHRLVAEFEWIDGAGDGIVGEREMVGS